MSKRKFMWDWVNGGYNWCFANSKEEALEVARNMCGLVPNEDSIREVSIQDIEKEDKRYAGFYY